MHLLSHHCDDIIELQMFKEGKVIGINSLISQMLKECGGLKWNLELGFQHMWYDTVTAQF